MKKIFLLSFFSAFSAFSIVSFTLSCNCHEGTECIDDKTAIVSINSPVNGSIIATGAVTVTGTADTDINSVSLDATQGIWTDINPSVSGEVWSSTIKNMVTGSTVTITVRGTDNCGNIGSDSVMVCVPPCVWYVNDDASGTGTGLSWIDAFTTVQDSVGVAMTGDVIFVAEGIYMSGTTAPVLPMKEGVEIYGGFIGTESGLPNRGNPGDYPTILDGKGDSYHVVVGASNARLDGFTITGGDASLEDCGFEPIMEECKGGGMYNYNVANLTVANCTFNDNWAIVAAGMYNWFSSPTITNCIFIDNYTNFGGGMLNDNSSPTINNCSFISNGAVGGGGMCNNNSSPTITNCIFSNNGANDGGGIFNTNSSPEITNCAFISNGAVEGGGMSNYNSSPEIINCIFIDNSAPVSGGGMSNNDNSEPTITNCIMWGNTAPTGPEITLYSTDSPSTLTISYSDVQGGPSTGVYTCTGCTLNLGDGMIEDDPKFVGYPLDGGTWSFTPTYDTDTFQTTLTDGTASWTPSSLTGLFLNPDTSYDLQLLIVDNTATNITVWGDITDFADDEDSYEIFDYHLQSISPCKDTGTADGAPSKDLDGNFRPSCSGYDMGAYEYQCP